MKNMKCFYYFNQESNKKYTGTAIRKNEQGVLIYKVDIVKGRLDGELKEYNEYGQIIRRCDVKDTIKFNCKELRANFRVEKQDVPTQDSVNVYYISKEDSLNFSVFTFKVLNLNSKDCIFYFGNDSFYCTDLDSLNYEKSIRKSRYILNPIVNSGGFREIKISIPGKCKTFYFLYISDSKNYLYSSYLRMMSGEIEEAGIFREAILKGLRKKVVRIE
ncbi:MAG: hypothetical protein ACT6QS_08140 [Flavobacteriales bacterium]